MKKQILYVTLAAALTASFALSANASELVDGKFEETKHITVEVYDRGIDGGSDVTNNDYTRFIKEGMLEAHNVEVEFVAVPRWTEVEQINNLLAAGSAPDLCVTYDLPTIKTYSAMGGVIDMADLVETYKDDLPNLWNWLTETNIYWDKDPSTGELYDIETKLANQNRTNCFVRADWLAKLEMEAPTTKEEFYNMLCAFRDNAELLLGDDADKMIPFSVSYDVGWRASTLIESFLDPEMTDKEFYVNGFDDRKLTENGVRNAIELLNKWYNEGLMWKDFALYTAGDTTEDDMMKAGYVGAFIHNWDYPYRNGTDSIQANLQRLVGEDAAYVSIDPFEDRNGTHTKWIAGPIDRKVFFPITNQEPLACLLYLDWLSTPENLQYLQIGEEGVTHELTEDGAVKIIAATGDAIQNSGFNIDYTLTCNGLHLVDDAQTALSIAYSYAEVDPALVETANAVAKVDTREGKNANCGTIEAENGMTETLNSKRDILLDTAVSASVEDFASVFDNAMADYLGSGGQAIMDERQAKWESIYGDEEMLP
ncbi:MAG: extracellular solute-binding protein [Blautia sp.]|nr:extracellular solute-binding protein [Blautia sp.]